MKRLLASLLLLFSTSAFAHPLTVAVLEVYDGDTIDISALLPPPLDELSVRVLGIDTPEKPADSYYETGKLNRADCVAEAELALKATEHVKKLIAESGNRITLDNFSWDKYGGRINADVYIGNLKLSDHLIEQGYAVPYDGGAKTHSWCD
jgi:endonuclease YncB( thermonuclease family)